MVIFWLSNINYDALPAAWPFHQPYTCIKALDLKPSEYYFSILSFSQSLSMMGKEKWVSIWYRPPVTQCDLNFQRDYIFDHIFNIASSCAPRSQNYEQTGLFMKSHSSYYLFNYIWIGSCCWGTQLQVVVQGTIYYT